VLSVMNVALGKRSPPRETALDLIGSSVNRKLGGNAMRSYPQQHGWGELAAPTFATEPVGNIPDGPELSEVAGLLL
jgi:hypothetical protein